MKQESIRHHYIPQFYTGLWASKQDLKITQFSKPNGKVVERRRYPVEVGFKDYLYTFEGSGSWGKNDIEDVFFKQVDLFGSQVIEYIFTNCAVPTDELSRNKFLYS